MRNITFLGSTNTDFGRGKDKKKRKNKLLYAASRYLAVITNGNPIDRETVRYNRSGPRTRLGKIGHDAVIGANTLGTGSAFSGLVQGFNRGKSLKSKLYLGLSKGAKEGLRGALSGAGIGATIGTGRGLFQPNRKKKT